MNKLKKGLLFGFVKGFLIYFLYGVFTLPAAMLIRNSRMEKKYVPGFWNEELYCIVSFVFSLIFFFSLVSIFTLYDKHFRNTFSKTENEYVRFFAKCKFIFSSRAFWIEVLVLFVLIAIFPYLTPFSEFYYAFFRNAGMSLGQGNLVIIAFMVPLFFILTFMAYMSTVNWWQRLRIKKVLHREKRTLVRFIIQIAYTLIIYLVGAATLCIVVPMFYTLFSVIKFILMGFFVAVILILMLAFVMKYGSALSSRYKFMKKLLKLCDARRYKITNKTAIYKSVIFNIEGANFTLVTGNATYRCKLVCCPKKKKSLYFREHGDVFYSNDILGIIKHTTSFSYTFDDKDSTLNETQKIIIVSPSVEKLFATDDATDRMIYSGESVMGYKMYQSSDFIGFVERRCL